MTKFAFNGPNWIEIDPASGVVIDGVATSYETLATLWTPQMRTARGIKQIVDDAIPDGQVATGSTLVDDTGKPRRAWALEPAPLEPVPSVTRAQALLALYDAGLLDQVEAIVAAHPYPPVRIWFANALNWHPDNAYVQAIALELGLSDAQVVDLFRAAALKV